MLVVAGVVAFEGDGLSPSWRELRPSGLLSSLLLPVVSSALVLHGEVAGDGGPPAPTQVPAGSLLLGVAVSVEVDLVLMHPVQPALLLADCLLVERAVFVRRSLRHLLPNRAVQLPRILPSPRVLAVSEARVSVGGVIVVFPLRQLLVLAVTVIGGGLKACQLPGNRYGFLGAEFLVRAQRLLHASFAEWVGDFRDGDELQERAPAVDEHANDLEEQDQQEENQEDEAKRIRTIPEELKLSKVIINCYHVIKQDPQAVDKPERKTCVIPQLKQCLSELFFFLCIFLQRLQIPGRKQTNMNKRANGEISTEMCKRRSEEVSR